MLKCYFCQQEGCTRPVHYEARCSPCAVEYGLKDVVTTYDGVDLWYAHIITHNGYHYRLHFRENITVLEPEHKLNRLVELSGFPITPANANAKLKTLLVFS
jgi:hypothetical protein